MRPVDAYRILSYLIDVHTAFGCIWHGKAVRNDLQAKLANSQDEAMLLVQMLDCQFWHRACDILWLGAFIYNIYNYIIFSHVSWFYHVVVVVVVVVIMSMSCLPAFNSGLPEDGSACFGESGSCGGPWGGGGLKASDIFQLVADPLRRGLRIWRQLWLPPNQRPCIWFSTAAGCFSRFQLKAEQQRKLAESKEVRCLNLDLKATALN